MVVQDGELITRSGASLIVQLHFAFSLLLFHYLCPSLPSRFLRLHFLALYWHMNPLAQGPLSGESR